MKKHLALGLAITLTFTACGEHTLEELLGLDSSSSEEEEYSSSSLQQSSSSQQQNSSSSQLGNLSSSSHLSSSSQQQSNSSSSPQLGTSSSSSQQQSSSSSSSQLGSSSSSSLQQSSSSSISSSSSLRSSSSSLRSSSSSLRSSSSSLRSSSSSLRSSSSSVAPSSSSLSSSSSSQQQSGDPGSCDIKDYKTVQIGTQTWMAENYNCKDENGGSACYKYDQANCPKYGRLYLWITAMNLPSSCNSSTCASRINAKHRGICPAGWHIPSDADWNVLMKFANPNCKDNSSCADAGTKLKAANGWTEDGGTDDFGFAALPGGGVDAITSEFYGAGLYGNWWSAGEADSKLAYIRSMGWSYEYVGRLEKLKTQAHSVRCIKD